MTYVLVRIFSGSGELSHEELLQTAGKELVPQVLQAGCKRYSTIAFADGRVGSSSFYDDRVAADRGNQIALKWAEDVMRGYKLAQTIHGEVIYSFQGNQAARATEGEIRLYKTTASPGDVEAALREEAQPILAAEPGLVRYTCFTLDNGQGYAMMTGHASRPSSTQLSHKAREARQKGGSRLQRVMPQDPEVIQGTIVQSFT